MRGKVVLVLLVFIAGSFSTVLSWAADSNGHVGQIKVPPASDPRDYYSLERNGKTVIPLLHDMRVKNEDIVTLKSGKAVKLVYFNTSCPDVLVTSKKKVFCSPAKPGMLDRFAKRWKEVIYGPTMEETQLMTLKGNSGGLDCFPSYPFLMAPWPVNGTTLLSGGPMHFRWKASNVPTCSPGRLVIVSSANKENRVYEKAIKIGALVTLEAGEAAFEPGKAYSWFIESEQEKKIMSDQYHFRALSVDERREIMGQLTEIKEMYAGENTYLAQALYLQMLSDERPDLDLYADSLVMIERHIERNNITQAIIDRVYDHAGGGLSP